MLLSDFLTGRDYLRFDALFFACKRFAWVFARSETSKKPAAEVALAYRAGEKEGEDERRENPEDGGMVVVP